MLADQWSRWLPTDALTDMRRVGSYSMLLEPVRAHAIRAPAPTLVRSTCLTPCEPDTGPARNFAQRRDVLGQQLLDADAEGDWVLQERAR